MSPSSPKNRAIMASQTIHKLYRQKYFSAALHFSANIEAYLKIKPTIIKYFINYLSIVDKTFFIFC